ncbi:MAG: hypothetical protein WED07_11530 [Candidatus Freyarchaeum deiterrae]
MSYRPSGVTALTVVFFIIGGLAGCLGTFMGVLYSALTSYFTPQSIFNQIGVIVIFIVAEMYVFAAIGLFRMKNWGRILALILGVIMIIGSIFLLLIIVGIIPLTIGIIVVVYLMTDVKYEFE